MVQNLCIFRVCAKYVKSIFGRNSGLRNSIRTPGMTKNMVKLVTWTGNEKYDATSANSITFEACDDANICCKRLLDKDLKIGAKDEFPMSEDFKQCWKDLDKKNFYMSTNSIDGWKAKEIEIHYHDQTSVVCTLSEFLKEGEVSRLPLICGGK